jgi:hypothetical protein
MPGFFYTIASSTIGFGIGPRPQSSKTLFKHAHTFLHLSPHCILNASSSSIMIHTNEGGLKHHQWGLMGKNQPQGLKRREFEFNILMGPLSQSTWVLWWSTLSHSRDKKFRQIEIYNDIRFGELWRALILNLLICNYLQVSMLRAVTPTPKARDDYLIWAYPSFIKQKSLEIVCCSKAFFWSWYAIKSTFKDPATQVVWDKSAQTCRGQVFMLGRWEVCSYATSPSSPHATLAMLII